MSERPLKRLKSVSSDSRSRASSNLPTTVHLENVPQARMRPPHIDTGTPPGIQFQQHWSERPTSPTLKMTSLKTISPQVSPTSVPSTWNDRFAYSASSRNLGGRTPSVSQSQTFRQQAIQFAEDPFTRANRRNTTSSQNPPKGYRMINIGTEAPPPRWILVEETASQRSLSTWEERSRARLARGKLVGKQVAANVNPGTQPGPSTSWNHQLRGLRWEFEPGSPGARGELSEAQWHEIAWQRLEEALKDPKTREELREKINVGPLDNTVYTLEDPLPPIPPAPTFSGAQVRKSSIPESSVSLSTEPTFYYPDYDRPSLAVQPGVDAPGRGGPASIARKALDQMRTAIAGWANNRIPRRGSEAAPIISHSYTEERRSKEAHRSPLDSLGSYFNFDEERQQELLEREEEEGYHVPMGHRPAQNIPGDDLQPTRSISSGSKQQMATFSQPAHGLSATNSDDLRREAAEALAALRTGGQEGQQAHPTTGGKQVPGDGGRKARPQQQTKSNQIGAKERWKHFPKRRPFRRMKIWSGVWIQNTITDQGEFMQLAEILPSTDRPFRRTKKITVKINTTKRPSEPETASRATRSGTKKRRDVAPQNEEPTITQDDASGPLAKRARRNPVRRTKRK